MKVFVHKELKFLSKSSSKSFSFLSFASIVHTLTHTYVVYVSEDMDIQNIFLHISGKRCPLSPHQSRRRTKSSSSRGAWAEKLEENLSLTL